MERQTIRAIEAKAARVRKRFRINPDRIIRSGACVVAVLGATAVLIGCLTDWLPGTQAARAGLGGAGLRAIILFAPVVIVLVLYELYMRVVDFARRSRNTRPDHPTVTAPDSPEGDEFLTPGPHA